MSGPLGASRHQRSVIHWSAACGNSSGPPGRGCVCCLESLRRQKPWGSSRGRSPISTGHAGTRSVCKFTAEFGSLFSRAGTRSISLFSAAEQRLKSVSSQRHVLLRSTQEKLLSYANRHTEAVAQTSVQTRVARKAKRQGLTVITGACHIGVVAQSTSRSSGNRITAQCAGYKNIRTGRSTPAMFSAEGQLAQESVRKLTHRGRALQVAEENWWRWRQGSEGHKNAVVISSKMTAHKN